jgi:hypothetical protein
MPNGVRLSSAQFDAINSKFSDRLFERLDMPDGSGAPTPATGDGGGLLAISHHYHTLRIGIFDWKLAQLLAASGISCCTICALIHILFSDSWKNLNFIVENSPQTAVVQQPAVAQQSPYQVKFDECKALLARLGGNATLETACDLLHLSAIDVAPIFGIEVSTPLKDIRSSGRFADISASAIVVLERKYIPEYMAIASFFPGAHMAFKKGSSDDKCTVFLISSDQQYERLVSVYEDRAEVVFRVVEGPIDTSIPSTNPIRISSNQQIPHGNSDDVS